MLFDPKLIGGAVITEGRQSGGELQAAAGGYELTLRFDHTEGVEIESLILE